MERTTDVFLQVSDRSQNVILAPDFNIEKVNEDGMHSWRDILIHLLTKIPVVIGDGICFFVVVAGKILLYKVDSEKAFEVIKKALTDYGVKIISKDKVQEYKIGEILIEPGLNANNLKERVNKVVDGYLKNLNEMPLFSEFDFDLDPDKKGGNGGGMTIEVVGGDLSELDDFIPKEDEPNLSDSVDDLFNRMGI